MHKLICRQISFGAALLCLLVALASPQPALATVRPPQVTCRACIVVDETGHVLWGRAVRARVAIASTTKLVTALVVTRRGTLDDEVRVSAAAAATPQGKLDLVAGETLTVRELLYGLLLNSSNDAAVALAEHVGGSVSAFVDMMNEEAARLDLQGTRFVTPHGLDAPGHHSTARDLATVGSAVLSDPSLAPIVGTAHAEVSSSRRTIALDNTNVLLESYRGAIGVKTGFTSQAGNVLVAAARRRGRTVLTVALHSDDSFADSVRLLDYGFAVLRREILLDAMAPVADVVFDPSGATSLVAGRRVRGLAAPDAVEVAVALDPQVEPPVERGERVGTVTVTDGTRTVARVPALATSGLEGGAVSGAARVLGGLLGFFARVLPGEGG